MAGITRFAFGKEMPGNPQADITNKVSIGHANSVIGFIRVIKSVKSWGFLGAEEGAQHQKWRTKRGMEEGGMGLGIGGF
jgi:hypothetical protein